MNTARQIAILSIVAEFAVICLGLSRWLPGWDKEISALVILLFGFSAGVLAGAAMTRRFP